MDGWNYFNYFTEIEEYFWKKRGAHLLVSPLDWAIMEAWQKAGVPLEAALKGIDNAFASYQRSRRGAGKPGVLYGRGAGGRGRTTGGGGGENTENSARSGQRSVSEG
jgi:hypothetical protein